MRNFKDHLILSGSEIRSALVRLNTLSKDAILFVVDLDSKLIGALTDGDVRRGLINGISIDMPIDEIIQVNPRFIRKGDRDIKKVIELRESNFRLIPVVDKNNRVVNVINFGEVRSYLPVDAVIMAGGRGQRLSPLTDGIPKPLLKVGIFPIIEHNVNRLSLYGIDDFWISLRYLGEQIESHFGDGHNRNINIQYVWEAEPLGTIGAVSKIDNFQHEYVLVTNSDILTNLDYEHFFLEFLKNDCDLGVVTIPYKVNVPYAVLETIEGNVVNLVEKPTYTYYSNGGIYLIKREILNLLPKNDFFNTTDLIEKLISEGKKVFSYPLIGYWLDIGSAEDYRRAQEDINFIKF